MSNLSKTSIVIPAKAGIQRLSCKRHWVPAFAGTTAAIWTAGIQPLRPRPTRGARPPPGHAPRGVRLRGDDGVHMSEFIAMGGYGFYVWGAYVVTALIIVAELVALRARRRAAEALAAGTTRTEATR